MLPKDLREFIQALSDHQELQVIDQEVDWNLEIGAITRRGSELSAPCPLFTNIKDYPGWRMFANSIAKWPRIALAMGMDYDATPTAIITEYMHRMQRPIKSVQVSDGPCKEVKYLGDKVNLKALPVPFIHQGDGGRYIGTWHFMVNKDPDSDWVNWGMYRQMMHDEKTMGGLFIPTQHGPSIYYQKYEARNKPMEFATVIGADPISSIVSANPVGYGVSEVDIAGGILQRPIELVKCETVDLWVPANAEIILEGVVLPKERREEGPFGEYTGFMGGGRAPRPVYHVKAITHRKDPILTMSNMGMFFQDCDFSTSLGVSAELTKLLVQKGFPIRDVAYCVPQGSMHLLTVSTKVPYFGIAKQIAAAVWGDKAGIYIPYVIVCDEDVDPTSMDEVIHDVVQKCHPVNGITVIPNMPGHPLTPFITPYERQHSINHFCLLDCTWPKDWLPEEVPGRISFEVNYPKEIQEKVLKNWHNYGYK